MIEEIRRQQIAVVKRRKKKMRRQIMLGIFCLLCCGLGVFVALQLYGNRNFEVTYYDLTTKKLKESLCIAVLSDLHSTEYGDKNSDLIAAIEKEKPDFIAMLGDMVNQDDTDITVVRTLCSQLAEIAPVYYSMGNHEGTMMTTRTDSIAINEILKSDGVHVLYNQVEDFVKGHDTVRIAGISTSYNNYDTWSKERIEDFWDYDGYKIMLSHYPALYYSKLKDADLDLALAGHYHGGIIRIPGLGGLYHPEDGFFPKYSGGRYSLTKGELIVSRGLGDSHFIPRINNRPELVIVHIN